MYSLYAVITNLTPFSRNKRRLLRLNPLTNYTYVHSLSRFAPNLDCLY